MMDHVLQASLSMLQCYVTMLYGTELEPESAEETKM